MKSKTYEFSTKERLFAFNYVNTGNIKESAIKAGYVCMPEKAGLKLLAKKEVSDEIDRLYAEKKKDLSYRTCIGYERLAFGSIVDAVKLLISNEIDDLKLEKMDLFNISEIKVVKGGGMEIKFFDRLRALEKLEQSSLIQANEAVPFYKALEEGTKVFDRMDENDS